MSFTYESTSISHINSMPVCVLQAKTPLSLDSLFVTNTGNSPLFLTIRFILTRQDEKMESCFAKAVKIEQGFPKEFMSNSCFYFSKGDEILLHSDYAGNTLDCHLSWRPFLEEESF